MQNETIEGFHLSPQQKRIWSMQRDGRVFCAQCAVLISGSLDIERLTHALKELTARHEILRTGFCSLPGMELPLQIIGDSASVSLTQVDLSQSENPTAKVKEKFYEQLSLPFDYEQTGLARFTLLRFSDDSHVLLITLPSLCADAFSLQLLTRQLAHAYEPTDGNPEWSSEPLAYIEFSEWQNSLLESTDAPDDVLLQDVSEPGPVNISVLSCEGEEVSPDLKQAPSIVEFSFGADTVRQIEQTSETTADMEAFLLTTWQVLLSKLSHLDNVSVHCGFDRRNFVEFQNALGLFSSHIPICTYVESAASFAEIASRVAQQMATVRTNCEYRDDEHFHSRSNAQLPIGFDFARTELIENGATTFSVATQYVCTNVFKLHLSCLLTQSGLEVQLHFDPRLFSRENVALLGRRYVQLVRSILEAPIAAPIHALVLIDAAERQLLLHSNGPTVPERSNHSLHELFEAQVDKTPGAPAVKEQKSVTFGELNKSANRLAHYLRKKGVELETPVAIILERSVEMVAAVLAVGKAGGAYVPLEANHPKQRLASMLQCAKPRILLTLSHLLASLPDFDGEIICLDSCQSLLAAESDENPCLPVAADNLAYVIFTSGSTGTPKGVMIQHHSVGNLAAALRTKLYDGAETSLTITLNAPLSFDASLKQLVQLTYGHTLYVVSEKARADGSEMLRRLNDNQVNVLDCTPSHLTALLMAGLTDRCASSLQKVLVGGEALDPITCKQIAVVESIDFYNVYGPTECTDVTALCLVRNDETPNIGRPIDNVETFVLDDQMQLTPIGVPGELYIGGEGLGRGYLGRPDLTAHRFVPHPFDQGGSRLYRTGDRVRRKSDGRLEFLGRLDRQVKLHGFRVELGEINCALKRNSAVADAFVVVHDEATNSKRLVAYVVPRIKSLQPDGVGPLHKLPNGMLIAHQNQNETRYLYEEIFEKQTYLRHGVSLWDGMCIFDVGANIGMFSLFASRYCQNPKIYAFEPLLPIFKILRVNAVQVSGNIKVFPIGLSNESQSATFAYYPRYSMMSGLSKYARPDDEVEVVRTFLRNEQSSGAPHRTELLEHANDLLSERFLAEVHEGHLKPLSTVMADEGVERIDLLKIDVQRAELDVLDGISDGDWRKIEQIVMEVHDDPGKESRTARISARLESHGFRVVVEQDPLLKGTDRFNLYAVSLRSSSQRPADDVAVNATSSRVDQPDPLSPDTLRQFLQDQLPEYMIPSAFVVLDSLPLTVNGKVNVEALPLPELNSKGVKEFTPPQTTAEQILHDSWVAVLGVAKISIHDNFFDIGGDSIRCIQVQALAQKQGLTFSIQQLFRAQTICELAKGAELAEQTQTQPRVTEPFALLSYADRLKIPDDVEGAYPLAMLQKGMLYHSEYNSDGSTYHNVTSMCLRGKFDYGNLKEALRRLITRHEILRTSFNLSDFSEPLQLVHRHVDLPLEVNDLRSSDAEDRERTVDRWIEEERLRRFDLSRAPLVRFQVHYLSDDTFQFSWAEHHACLDGWSLSSMISELFQSYAELLRGEDHVKTSPAFSFRDFVALERDTLASRDCSDFWSQKLSNVTRTTLPQNPAESQLTSGRRVSLHRRIFPAKECEKLKRVATMLGVPLKSVFLAAHVRVLSVLSGQTEVLTGLVSNGRQEEEGGDQILGLFINNLPFRFTLKGGSWASLIKAIFDSECELLPARRFPYAELQRMVGSPRLLDTYFNYSNFHVLQNLDQLQEISFLGSRHIAVDVDFTLGTDFEVNATSGEVELCLSFDVTKLSRESIEALTDRYEQALSAIADTPDANYETLPLLTPTEHDLLRTQHRANDGHQSVEDCIHRLFEAQVERTPTAVCLVGKVQQLTFLEVNTRANQLARYLKRRGLCPENRVGLLLERSVDCVIAMIATLKAGAAYVPLDLNYPVQRLRYMVQDSALNLLLTHSDLASLADEICMTETEAELIVLDQILPQVSLESELNLLGSVSLANLAYVLYTSGSTGFPKGVAIEHRNTVSLLRWAGQAFSAAELAAVIASSPFTFDSSAFELWAPITQGGKALLVQNLFDISSSPFANEGTLLSTVPSLMREFLRTGTLPPNVRTVVFAGEPLEKNLLQQIHAFGVERVWNLYGLTEDTTFSTGAIFNSAGCGALTIGTALNGRQVYVLDNWMQSVPIGTVGKIFVGGEGLTRGYLNQPELTACHFVPNPLSGVPGDRLYRTGDLARLSASGSIEFLGRVDHQVKLHGCRIELTEIESSLLNHPSVEGCVAHVTTDSREASHLAAYVVTTDDSVDVDELRRYLGGLVPHYMIPKTFTFLSALPLLSNGKVNRQALPSSHLTVAADRPFTAPTTPLQISIADIWSEAFGIGPLSVDDDFFELGGHSLLALQVVFRLRQLLGIDIPVRTLADAPTLSRFAQKIEALQVTNTTTTAITVSQLAGAASQ